MNAVAGVGAPSYASGVHWWNGTTAALKASPTVTSASATRVAPFVRPPTATASAMPANVVVPERPYSHAKPYRSIAELNAPRRKYLSAASLLKRSRRAIPAST